MALKKTITDSKGVVSEYHKIRDFDADNKLYRKKKGEEIIEAYIINVNVSCYVSAKKREIDDSLNCGKLFFSLAVTPEELNTRPILPLLYDKLKETPMFDGAEDC